MSRGFTLDLSTDFTDFYSSLTVINFSCGFTYLTNLRIATTTF